MSPKPSKGKFTINAIAAVSKVVDPLIRFAIEIGLSVTEIEGLVREAAVRAVARRQSSRSGRVSVSGIAAVTGLSRTEVSRHLQTGAVSPKRSDAPTQVTNRVLRAWHEDPKYIDPVGRPLDLDLFGKDVSFEMLVRQYGGGLPVRALLEELLSVDAVELVDSQIVRATASIAIERGLQPKMIESFGDRGAEFLEAMLRNLQDDTQPKFIATIEAQNVSKDILALIRKEVASRGVSFLSNLEGSLFPEPRSARRVKADQRNEGIRASVTIFYFDNENGPEVQARKATARRNFRRKSKAK